MRIAPVLCAVFVPLLHSCSSDPATAPLLNPLLADLEIAEHRLIDGALIIEALQVDSTSLLVEDDRIRMKVRTNRGEAEDLPVGPEICEADDAQLVHCTQLSIGTEAGRRVLDFMTAIRQLPAWLFWVHSDGDLGGIEILDGTVSQAMTAIQQWHGISFVELASAEFTLMENVLNRQGVRGLKMVEFTEPVVGDGTIQVLAGDSLVVEYEQPDGTTLMDLVIVRCDEPDPRAIGRPPVVPECR